MPPELLEDDLELAELSPDEEEPPEEAAVPVEEVDEDAAGVADEESPLLEPLPDDPELDDPEEEDELPPEP